MGAYMSDKGDNKKNFRIANALLAKRVYEKLIKAGVTIPNV